MATENFNKGVYVVDDWIRSSGKDWWNVMFGALFYTERKNRMKTTNYCKQWTCGFGEDLRV